MSSRRWMRARIDVDAQRHAVVHRDRQRLGAAHAAEAGGERDRAGQRAAEAAPADLGEALVGALEDPLGADVDPRAGRHLAVHRQAQSPRVGGTRPSWPSPARGWSWRSAPAAPIRGCGTRRPACPTGRASSRRRRACAACAAWRRRRPTTGPPGRCRRRRRGRRAARRPPGRGCSAASGTRPPAANHDSSARGPEERGRDGRRRSSGHCPTRPGSRSSGRRGSMGRCPSSPSTGATRPPRPPMPSPPWPSSCTAAGRSSTS